LKLPLVGENCIVRDANFDDIQNMTKWRNEGRMAFFDQRLVSVRQTMQFLEEAEGLHCIVEYDGQACGYSSIYNIDEKTRLAEVGRVVMDPSFRGKGIMSEARRLMVVYMFAQTPIEKLYAVMRRDNPIGIKFHLAVGFELEGIRKKHFLSMDSFLVDGVFGGMQKWRYFEDFDWKAKAYRNPDPLSELIVEHLGL